MKKHQAEEKLKKYKDKLLYKHFNIDSTEFVAIDLSILPINDDEFDVFIRLAPDVKPLSPMRLDKFLKYPQWKEYINHYFNDVFTYEEAQLQRSRNINLIGMEVVIKGKLNKVVDIHIVPSPENQTDKYAIEIELKDSIMPSITLQSLLYHMDYSKS
jgi:hypothetical protein